MLFSVHSFIYFYDAFISIIICSVIINLVLFYAEKGIRRSVFSHSKGYSRSIIIFYGMNAGKNINREVIFLMLNLFILSINDQFLCICNIFLFLTNLLKLSLRKSFNLKGKLNEHKCHSFSIFIVFPI